jgi:hypothetical protein
MYGIQSTAGRANVVLPTGVEPRPATQLQEETDMAYDGKYGQVTTERGNIGDDEPVFVIRAQDKLSAEVIDFYRSLCTAYEAGPDHIRAVETTWNRFEEWQVNNHSKMKVPDTQPGQYQ